jgi:DNA-binding response OmpR family regulator
VTGPVHGVRVMLVDDQAEFMEAMAAVVLETPGFLVVGQVGTGEQCLRVCSAGAPDLVLLDVNLPGLDGVEVARRLRAGQAPPVVFLLSTYDEDAGERFVADSGANAYISKALLAPDVLARACATARL